MDQDVCQSLIAVKMAVAVVFEISYLAFGDMTVTVHTPKRHNEAEPSCGSARMENS